MDLFQPIFTKTPEPNHDVKNVLPFSEFVQLLKEEEDYYPGEQNNTSLMITRLRKIFYDKWGWNDELIKGAAHIESRYDVLIVEDATEHTREVTRYKKFSYEPKYRSVVYKSDDKVYGSSRAGQPTFIYSNDHQEVVLPDGTYCDIAHILSGIDAANYKQVVSPIPFYMGYLTYVLPYVASNKDMATWLGDIGSISSAYFFHYLLNKKVPSLEEAQNYIILGQPGSDMLGNIDAYVINSAYDLKTNNGMRFTDILNDYYLNDQSPRKSRISIYCRELGLGEWDGKNFSNEENWIKDFKKQLRNETSFQIFSVTDEKIHSIWMPLVVWLGFYKDILQGENLLRLMVKALKTEMENEVN